MLATYNAKMKTPFAVLVSATGAAVTGIGICRWRNARRPRQRDRRAGGAATRATSTILSSVSPCRSHRLARRFAGASGKALGTPWGIAHLGELAADIHSAPRAVGGACGANNIALVIPCHRVVGSLGSLGGFMHAVDGDPLAIKRWLLTHEGYRFGA